MATTPNINPYTWLLVGYMSVCARARVCVCVCGVLLEGIRFPAMCSPPAHFLKWLERGCPFPVWRETSHHFTDVGMFYSPFLFFWGGSSVHFSAGGGNKKQHGLLPYQETFQIGLGSSTRRFCRAPNRGHVQTGLVPCSERHCPRELNRGASPICVLWCILPRDVRTEQLFAN